MSREIKFRGRLVDNGEWVYGVPIFSKDDPQIAYILQNSGEYVVQAKTVGQFIGLKDRKKVEIYEGDILLYFLTPEEQEDCREEKFDPDWKEIVYWNEKEACFRLKDKNGEDDWGRIQHDVWSEAENGRPNFNVVGDVYNNPELLK